VAQHDRGVDVDDQARHLKAGRRRGGQATARLGQLRPRHLPRRGASHPQPTQPCLVDAVKHPPGRGIPGHLAEQLRLIPQHRQIRDRLTAIGEHHGDIDGHPTRIMTGFPAPQRSQRLTETAGQARHVGDVGQQTGAGVPNDPFPVRHNRDLGA